MTLAGGVPVLELVELSKSYGPTRALDQVSLTVAQGEVHALLGANGSGKSTLIRVLAGVEAAESSSRLLLRGRDQDLSSWDAARARSSGLRFVHQDPCLFPTLSVAENIAADGAMARSAFGRVRWADVRHTASELLRRFDIDLDPRQPLKSLAPADRTLVAVVRAMRDIDQRQGEAAVLVLDEPTASLPRAEVDRLLGKIRGLARQGHGILYVSHRLDEILNATDAITVIRDGRNVQTVPTAGTSEDTLVELITGRHPKGVDARPAVNRSDGAVLLKVDAVRTDRLRGVTFDLRSHEVVGIAGMLGSGRSHLLKAIFGAVQITAGHLEIGGRVVEHATPGAAVRNGVAYVPEDRHQDAAFLAMDLDANISAAVTSSYWGRWRLRHGRRKRDSAQLLAEFQVVHRSPQQSLATLSGGNQQKVMLARWLRTQPRIILLDEPTQGVDVGAREEIHRMVRRAAAEGAGALVVASDIQELVQICDRVLVMRDGAVIRELASSELDPAVIQAALFARQEVTVS